MMEEVKGRAKGGKAAAALLTDAQKKERASKAAKARWARPRVPKAKNNRIELTKECENLKETIEVMQRVIDQNELAITASRLNLIKNLVKQNKELKKKVADLEEYKWMYEELCK